MPTLTKPTIEWKPSPNFWDNRKGHTVEAIVLHITDGTLQGVLSWFGTEKSQVSAHYVIAKDGHVYNMVKEECAAWHAGIVVRPKWPGYHKGVNPNLYTIGIEVVGFADDRYTLEQYESLMWLIRDISERHSIDITADTLVNHRDIDAAKTCPGVHNDASIVRTLNWLID